MLLGHFEKHEHSMCCWLYKLKLLQQQQIEEKETCVERSRVFPAKPAQT